MRFLSIVTIFFIAHLGSSQTSSEFSFLSKEDGLPSNWISCMQLDQRGFLWIGTQNGLSRFDGKDFMNFYHDPVQPNSLIGNWVRTLALDEKDQFWIGTVGGGLQRFDPRTFTFNSDFTWQDSPPKAIYFIHAEDNRLWLLTNQGLYASDTTKSHFTSIAPVSIEHIFSYTQNELLLMASSGVYLLHKSSNKIKRISELHLSSPAKLNQNQWIGMVKDELTQIEMDEDSLLIKKRFAYAEKLPGTPWNNSAVGVSKNDDYLLTTSSGILAIHPSTGIDKTWLSFDEMHQNAVVTQFLRDPKAGQIVGTNKGLYIHTAGGTYRGQLPASVVYDGIVRDVVKDDNNLLLGTDNGLLRVTDTDKEFILEEGRITAVTKYNNAFFASQVKEDGIKSIHILTDDLEEIDEQFLSKKIPEIGMTWTLLNTVDRLWIGGNYHLGYWDKERDSFIFINELGTAPMSKIVVLDVLMDSSGDLWIATLDGLYQVKDEKFEKARRFDQGSGEGLKNNLITALVLDKQENLWVGTEAGLHSYDRTLDQFNFWGRAQGLSDPKIMALASGEDNNIWISTISGGLFLMNTGSGRFYNYSEAVGMPTDDYLMSSILLHNDTLYLGSEQGLIQIPTTLMKTPEYPAIDLFVETVEITSGKGETMRFHEPPANFELKHTYGNLTFNLSALTYRTPEKTTFSYKVEGLYSKWVSLGNQSSVSLVNLPAGDYVVSFKATNPSYTPSILSFGFNVLKPWYLHNALILLYFVGSIVVCWLAFHFLKRREQQRLQMVHLKKVNELKSKLYAEISHEIKTPLTIIKGNTSLLEENKDTSRQEKLLRSIDRNTDDILNLVNQLLDLAAIDAQQFKLKESSIDLIAEIKKHIALFRSYAESQDKKLLASYTKVAVVTKIDASSFKKILFNLLSNALKFTPKGGIIKVDVTILEKQFKVSVMDSGVGISKDELSLIFDRYYKTFDTDNNLGSGIGMSLTQELVNLMGGNIYVESEVGKGSCFMITLPLQPNADKYNVETSETLTPRKSFPTAEPLPKESGARFKLLIVEDHPDMVRYYCDLLNDAYDLILVDNGEEAIAHVQSSFPDFILSDAVMPKMDGYELCRLLKNDWKTSHIPFIMVSGLGRAEDRSKAFEKGVEAFLEKPFDETELLAVIDSLLTRKKRVAEHIRKLLYAEENLVEERVNARDLEFIEKISEFCLDPQWDFSIQRLAKELGMSRTQLHRKIKALTELSATEYISHLRIEKAKNLLRAEDTSISEVAYAVGYSDPGYFAKIFKKITGQTASEFKNKVL
ncbi:two-component regulator propeller domain-containing protein [Gangjinia marincola]|uniref:histidine kinase n=1 Tax=Gangjinia marincola TaxID=578463 RepID=A0ABN1MGZ9_9FLAO